MDKKQTLLKLKEKIELFNNNYIRYRSNQYDESNTRVDFIDPFFEFLGWDVRNLSGYSEDYRDVVREDKVSIEGKTKAPDYSFRIGGMRKFFVEAKKPSVNLKDDISPAYQLRRYAYTAKLPLSILTDFEEFAVYDTRTKPNIKDNSSVARIFYCKFDEYEKNFDFIYDTFSKEAILKGSFDKYIQENKNKKGTSEVDKEILSLIENWRNELAKNIAIKNQSLDVFNLNHAVSKIIDRIIFLRIVEERGMEDYGTLQNLLSQKNIYNILNKIFVQANKKYNSGLFKIEKWIEDLIVDDKIFIDIIKSLYYPICPYEFSVLPVEILGSIYEQFLGKIIRLTSSHQAKIEEKPEVKKAGGVYYTPQYIVNYIVENTVGEIIKDKTPEKIKDIKIIDPACGSGSFLLGAYDYLLKYHLNYYTKNNASIKSAIKENRIYLVSEETYKLTIKEKREILINNIYGVDIDEQATEVSKLSLSLKLIEGEAEESAGRLLSKYNQETLLPDYSKNIKCGNSLIGPDFYNNKLIQDDEEIRKINAFDWQKEFKEIFDNGGFDVVIGNPPYVDSEEMVKSNKETRDYCSKNYEVAHGNWDMYCVFSEKGINVLNNSGFFSFIIPNKFLSAPYGVYLRKFFSRYYIKSLCDYSSVDVFFANNKKVNVYPIVIVVKKTRNENKNSLYIKMGQDNGVVDLEYKKNFKLKVEEVNWASSFDSAEDIINKIKDRSIKISDMFIVENSASVSEAYEIKKFILNKENNISQDSFFKFVNTGTIDRYLFLWDKFSTTYIKDQYLAPIILKSDIEEHFPKRLKSITSHKIILAGMVKDIEAAYDCGEIIPGKSTTIIMNDDNNNLKFLLGLLNSKLFSFVYKAINKYSAMAGGYLNINKNKIKDFIFPKTDNKKTEDKIIELVNQMLEVQKKYHEAISENDKKLYKQKIDIIDNQINKLVYELYGLTEEEIKIIEG